mgnify:CR=1 FL=1
MAAIAITLISAAEASAAVGTQFEAPIEYVYQGNTYTVNAKFEVISEVEKTCMPIGNSSEPCVNKQGMSEYDQRVVDLWASDMIVPEKVKGYTVTKIGEYAFYDIKHKITLPETVEEIGRRAFEYCYLKEFHFPKNLKIIRAGAFQHNSFKRLDTLPESIEKIEEGAFSNNKELLSFTLPKNVREFVSNYAFNNCPNLESIKVADGNTTYDSRNNCNAIVETATNKLMVGCKNTVIPSDIQIIGEYAFYRLSALTAVKIPASCTIIERYAFAGTGIKEIVIPEKTDVCAGNQFNACKDLEKAIIKCDTLWGSVFTGCSNLKTVYFLKNKKILSTNPGFQDDKVFAGIHPEAKLYVANLADYTQDNHWEWWFQDIYQIKFIDRLDITDYEWPMDFMPISHSANSATEGVEVEQVQYEMFRKIVYTGEDELASGGDNLGIGFTCSTHEGYWFANGVQAWLDGKQHEYKITSTAENQLRFVWTYKVPYPEGFYWIKSVNEKLPEPVVGEEPAWEVIQQTSTKSRDGRQEAKDMFDREKHYTVSGVRWFEVSETDKMLKEMQKGDKFKNAMYAAVVMLTPDEGYRFSEYTSSAQGMYMLNVKEYTEGIIDIDSAGIGFDYDLGESDLPGDVNGDGNVDISDIVAIINTIAGDNTYRDSANVNNDTNVDISDIVAVINIIASK